MYYICKLDKEWGDYKKVEGPFSNHDEAYKECKYMNYCEGYTDDDCFLTYYVLEEKKETQTRYEQSVYNADKVLNELKELGGG